MSEVDSVDRDLARAAAQLRSTRVYAPPVDGLVRRSKRRRRAGVSAATLTVALTCVVVLVAVVDRPFEVRATDPAVPATQPPAAPEQAEPLRLGLAGVWPAEEQLPSELEELLALFARHILAWGDFTAVPDPGDWSTLRRAPDGPEVRVLALFDDCHQGWQIVEAGEPEDRIVRVGVEGDAEFAFMHGPRPPDDAVELRFWVRAGDEEFMGELDPDAEGVTIHDVASSEAATVLFAYFDASGEALRITGGDFYTTPPAPPGREGQC